LKKKSQVRIQNAISGGLEFPSYSRLLNSRFSKGLISIAFPTPVRYKITPPLTKGSHCVAGVPPVVASGVRVRYSAAGVYLMCLAIAYLLHLTIGIKYILASDS